MLVMAREVRGLGLGLWFRVRVRPEERKEIMGKEIMLVMAREVRHSGGSRDHTR